ncbi:MAG TPA: hypothetical protein VF432_29620 [Thermoanaerobaculia bacterium]
MLILKQPRAVSREETYDALWPETLVSRARSASTSAISGDGLARISPSRMHHIPEHVKPGPAVIRRAKIWTGERRAWLKFISIYNGPFLQIVTAGT